jgi:hypothetical protein
MKEKLPTEMLSVVAYGPKDYRLEKKKTPAADTGEILANVVANNL